MKKRFFEHQISKARRRFRCRGIFMYKDLEDLLNKYLNETYELGFNEGLNCSQNKNN